jgi:hypothetical protein
VRVFQSVGRSAGWSGSARPPHAIGGEFFYLLPKGNGHFFKALHLGPIIVVLIMAADFDGDAPVHEKIRRNIPVQFVDDVLVAWRSGAAALWHRQPPAKHIDLLPQDQIFRCQLALDLKSEAKTLRISLSRSVIRSRAYPVRSLRLCRIEFSVHPVRGTKPLSRKKILRLVESFFEAGDVCVRKHICNAYSLYRRDGEPHAGPGTYREKRDVCSSHLRQ